MKKLKNFENMVVHSGVFHADDAMCCAMAKIVNPYVHIKRVNKVEHVPNTIVCDIGGGKYDHHQKDVPLMYDGTTKHCAVSLLWEDYGTEVVSSLVNLTKEDTEEVVKMVNGSLMRSIAIIDNGGSFEGNPFTISAIVSSFCSCVE